jgi:hypothetical protein
MHRKQYNRGAYANAMSKTTGTLPGMLQGDVQTHYNHTKNTAEEQNTMVLFMGGRVGACEDFGSWEAVLAEWLSPVVCEFEKKKIISHVEVLVST